MMALGPPRVLTEKRECPALPDWLLKALVSAGHTKALSQPNAQRQFAASLRPPPKPCVLATLKPHLQGALLLLEKSSSSDSLGVHRTLCDSHTRVIWTPMP